jgi:hypothetical protein
VLSQGRDKLRESAEFGMLLRELMLLLKKSGLDAKRHAKASSSIKSTPRRNPRVQLRVRFSPCLPLSPMYPFKAAPTDKVALYAAEAPSPSVPPPVRDPYEKFLRGSHFWLKTWAPAPAPAPANKPRPMRNGANGPEARDPTIMAPAIAVVPAVPASPPIAH